MTLQHAIDAPQTCDATSIAGTFAEFFAGIGLVRLALEQKGWRAAFANDIDHAKAKMYMQNWPNDRHLIVDDIHNLPVEAVPECDLFTASFPCNDLSIAGRWEGLNGNESSAFWGFTDILEKMGDRRPRLVLLENVVGFLMRRNGHDLEQALLALNQLGYSVDAVILNASRWTPQSRARLFIIGDREPNALRSSTGVACDARPEALARFIFLNQHIQWSIRPTPPLPCRDSHLADIIEDLDEDDPHWWNHKRTEYIMTQFSPKHRAIADQLIEKRSFSYATAFRRVRKGRSMAELRTDGVAGCLRTPRGGSGRQILFKFGKGEYHVRLVTARECARLQGVPETYRIDVPLNQSLFGFGDAVCVPAVAWIAEHYLTPLINGS